MVDGPTSFIVVFGLLGVAVLGALGLLGCVAALFSSRLRRHASSLLAIGAGVGLVALVVMCALLTVTLDNGDRSRSLFVGWGTIAFLAGFALGGAAGMGARLARSSRRPA